MAFCKNCGEQLNENQAVCLKCGAAVEQPKSTPQVSDEGGIGWGLLGFCVPIVGLVLYIVWKDSRPRTAKDAGVGALVGFIVGIVVGFISAMAGF